MRSLIRFCAVVTLTLACSGMDSAPTLGAPAPDVPARLTPQHIPQVLSQMGYEPVRQSDGLYHVVVNRPGYTISVRVSLCGDESVIWLTAHLGTVDTERLTPGIYRGLLSRDTSTARFHLEDEENRARPSVRELMISQPTPNHSITRARLREEVDAFCNTVVRLAPVWEPSLTASTTASAKPLVSGKPSASSNLFKSPKPLFSPKPLVNSEPYTIPNPRTNPQPFVAPRSFTSILNGR